MGEFADRMMSVKEAADYLGVTKPRVDQFIKDKRLTVAEVAGGIRFLLRADVEAFKDRPRMKRGPKPKTPKPGRGKRA